MFLINHASAPNRGKMSPTSKVRRKASRNKFVKNSGISDRVESFGKVDSSKNRPRARLGLVKPIRNVLRKKQILI